MTTTHLTISPRTGELFIKARQFSVEERLVLAKLLLDSLLTQEPEEEADWGSLGLAAFEKEWNNADDAVYDNWRDLYGVQSR